MGEAIELTADALMAQAVGHRRARRLRRPVVPRAVRRAARVAAHRGAAVGLRPHHRRRCSSTSCCATGCCSPTCSHATPRSTTSRSRRPIIIAGLPRTGTTHLQNLISADPALRSLPYWESVEPFPAPGDVIGPDGVDPRITRCDASLAVLDCRRCPTSPACSTSVTHHAHEEINLLAIDFSTMYFDTLGPDADLARALPGPRPDAALRVPAHRAQGAAVPAGRRPLGPQVAPAPRAVRTADPTRSPTPPCVVTHRDPASVVASMATMIAYTVAHAPRPGRPGGASATTGPTCCR